MIFCFQYYLSGFLNWGGFRVRVGDSFRVRVRERVSLRAKGWLGFMYYGLKLLESMLCSGGGFEKKTKSCREPFKISGICLTC